VILPSQGNLFSISLLKARYSWQGGYPFKFLHSSSYSQHTRKRHSYHAIGFDYLRFASDLIAGVITVHAVQSAALS
jgi:hypothetical protein